jgi:hypothetical protein
MMCKTIAHGSCGELLFGVETSLIRGEKWRNWTSETTIGLLHGSRIVKHQNLIRSVVQGCKHKEELTPLFVSKFCN